MNDLLNQLPEYDPRPDLWARIEADLLSDEQLARAINDLPTFEPKAHLWDDTLAADRQTTFTVTRSLWAGLTAAAVVVLVGVWLFLRPENDESVRVEYALEAAPSIPSPDGLPSTADQRAEEFIRQQCAEQTLACQRPEVHELRNQLTDLTAEQKRIEQERQTFGDDPRLVRAQVQIENQRADVTKELIALLRS